MAATCLRPVAPSAAFRKRPASLRAATPIQIGAAGASRRANTARVEYLTANSIRWRVLDTEDEVGAAFASVGYGSIRYMLVNQER